MRTITKYSQFVAFFDFDASREVLTVTLKNGRRYEAGNFKIEDHNRLKQQNNKGSYILHHVFKNNAYEKLEIEPITAKRVSEIIQETLYKRNQVHRYQQPPTGWNAFLAQ